MNFQQLPAFLPSVTTQAMPILALKGGWLLIPHVFHSNFPLLSSYPVLKEVPFLIQGKEKNIGSWYILHPFETSYFAEICYFQPTRSYCSFRIQPAFLLQNNT